MQLNRREAPLELEIQSLLILHGSADVAATILLTKYQNQKLHLPALELIATFCLHAGLPVLLLDFLCKQIQVEAEIPWGHFAEAYSLSQERRHEEIEHAIVEGAAAQKLMWHLSRSHVLDEVETKLLQEREKRRRRLKESAATLKNDLLLQADMVRSQEMDVQESRLLQRLLGLFPKDAQIQNLWQESRARKAMKLLDSKGQDQPEKDWDQFETSPDPESLAILNLIAQSMEEALGQNHDDLELEIDFAIAHWMWDYPEGSLRFLNQDLTIASGAWLRAESLLRTRRFSVLLSELLELEKHFVEDPEATYAISYLRAQALWGLGRKFDAIDIMEGILALRPHYRAGVALLSVWKAGKG